jgi:hypothetical protein
VTVDLKIKSAEGKVPMELVPLWVLEGLARVFEYGSRKYSRWNWTQAADLEAEDRYMGAALRHYAAMQAGGVFARDEESGLYHLDHLLCTLVILRGLLQLHQGMPADPGRGAEVA